MGNNLTNSRNVEKGERVVCIIHATLSLRPSLLPPPRVLKSILYVCIFIPVRSLGSSEPFFF